jgi:hypothetical protein
MAPRTGSAPRAAVLLACVAAVSLLSLAGNVAGRAADPAPSADPGAASTAVGFHEAPPTLAPRSGGPAPASGLYTVTFIEYSLPLGATWYVNITGQAPLSATVTIANGTSLALNLTNGNYSYVAATNEPYFSAGGAAQFNVSGAAVFLNVIYQLVPGIYEIVFLESGIAGGTNWSATVNGTLRSAFAPNAIVFYVPNGTYQYSITPVPGYTSNVTNGSARIDGSGPVYEVGFRGSASPGPTAPAGVPWDWLIGGAVVGGLVVLLVLIVLWTRRPPAGGRESDPGDPADGLPGRSP